MRLPDIDYTVGNPSVRPIDDPNEDIKLGLNIVGNAAEAFGVIKSGLDEAKMIKQTAIVSNQMGQIEDYLSSGDRININDPRMPDDVRTEIMQGMDTSDPEIVVEGEQTFVPTRRVMKPVVDYYQKKLLESADDVPDSRKQEYLVTNQNAYDKLKRKAAILERGYVLQDVQRSYAAGVSQQVQSGDMEGAIDTIARARNSGAFDDQQVASVTKNVIESFTGRFETQLSNYNNDLGAAAYSGNPAQIEQAQIQVNALVDEAVDRGLISPEQANEYVQESDSKAERLRLIGDVTRTYDNQGIAAANNALRHHETKKPANVSQEDWLKTIDAARTDVNQRYSDEQKIIASMKEIKESDKRIAQAMAAVNLGMPVVGRDAEAGMDKVYENTMQYGFANPDNRFKWAEMSVAMVEQTGYMPTGLRQDLLRMAANGEADPANAALAGDIYSRIQQMPNAADDIESMQDKVLLQEIAANTKAGLSPASAWATAAKTVAIDPTTRKLRGEQWTASAGTYKDTSKRISKASNKVYDQWFEDDPKKGEAYLVQFRDLERSAYLYTGDINKASKIAADQLNKVWRVTEVNGDRELMQFAPETMYPPLNGNSGWIKQDLDKYKATQLPDLVSQYGAENIIVESDYYTTHSKLVSYAVKVRDPNQQGVMFNATDKNGLRRRWYPDIKKNPDFKEQERVANERAAERQNDFAYQRSVFDRAVGDLSAIDSFDTGDNPDPRAQVKHIEEKAIPLMVQAFSDIEAEAPIEDKGMRSEKNQAAIKSAQQAYREAYNKKMGEVAKRVYERHAQKVAEQDAPTPSRGNPRPKTNYIPEM